jgi:hypothetical protein
MRHALLAALVIVGLASVTARGGVNTDVFAGDTPAELTLEAPLTELFDRSEKDPEASVKGQLTWRGSGSDQGVTLKDVEVSERGHTSRQSRECAFPKLKLDLTDSERTGSPLEGVDVLKLGTHCGDRADGELTPKYGRLANELAPQREALVYRILAAAGVPTLRARSARVTYVFEGTPREPLTRHALLLEDDDEAGKRVGASGDIDEKEFGSAREQFEPADTARLAFAEAMVGNFDWCLRMFMGDIYRCDERHPLWNVLAFTRPGQRELPVIYDFDLAGPVVGRHVWFGQVFDAAFVQPPSSVDVEVLSQLQRTRSLFDRALLDDTRAHFLHMREAIMATIARAAVDDRGRELARRYVGAFYAYIESDTRFYGPVVVDGGHDAFLDPEGTQPACPSYSTVPVGTAVSAPLEVRGDMTRVRLLDALWTWTGTNRCDRVHTQPIWIASSAIGTDYPR